MSSCTRSRRRKNSPAPSWSPSWRGNNVVTLSGINWPVVRLERRRPSWRQLFRNTGCSLNRYAYLTSSMRGRARKDLKETKVSAPRQSETREMTDENAVRLAQQGDVVAFERIYRLHSRKVYSLCLRMAGDASE